MMLPILQQTQQKNPKSLCILQKAIGRSIKVNCEKVVELIIDDLLLENVKLLNRIDSCRDQLEEKEKLMGIVSNFISTVEQYEKELTQKPLVLEEEKTGEERENLVDLS